MIIYIATPVTSRKEATMEERFAAARKRVTSIKKALEAKLEHRDVCILSTFDLGNTPETPEAVAMGRCVTQVINSDVIIEDFGHETSRGCLIESYVADHYGKMRIYYNWGGWVDSNYVQNEICVILTNIFAPK